MINSLCVLEAWLRRDTKDVNLSTTFFFKILKNAGICETVYPTNSPMYPPENLNKYTKFKHLLLY